MSRKHIHAGTTLLQLGEGVELLREHPGSAFVIRGVREAIEQVAASTRASRQAPVLDEQSLLCALAGVAMDLALYWEAQVGDLAWQGAPLHPHPLAVLLDGPLGEGGRATDPGLAAFVGRGLRAAMPLRADDAHAHSIAWRGGRKHLTDYHAQAVISRAAMVGRDWMRADEFSRAVKAAGGEWVFVEDLLESQVVANPEMDPGTVCSFLEDRHYIPSRGPWAGIWADGARRNGHQVMDWMDRHGCNTHSLRSEALAGGIARRATQAGGRRKEVWGDILGSLRAHPAPGAGGLPLGLLALQRNGSLLEEAIKNPPPGGLEATGPEGQGIWHALLVPDPNGEGAPRHAPWAAVARLLSNASTPFPKASQAGFLWSPWQARWTDKLLSATGKDSPQAWLGPAPKARERAVSALVAMACSETQSQPLFHATQVAARLATLWNFRPDSFDPVVAGVLGAMQALVQAEPARYSQAGLDIQVLETLRIPAASPGNAWAKQARRPLEHNQAHPDDPPAHRARALLDRLIEQVRLETRLPPARTPPRARGRI